jgi:hypothetical protein
VCRRIGEFIRRQRRWPYHDTAAIQATIKAAAAAGGGSVLFKLARYYTAGTLQVPGGVVLCGIDPATTAVAPTLLVTNTSAPFITLTGIGSGVTDMLFHYPNQLKTGASTGASAPTAYPYTIQIPSAVAAKVARSTVTNAYNFPDIERGRMMAADLMIGAFNIGVNVDNAEDFVPLRNLHNGVFWDEVENASYPTAIDNWVLAHGTALVVGRMDGFEVHDFYVFSRFTGMLLTDSPDTSLNPRCGNGRGSDIDLEMVQYGIIATAGFPGIGYKFTNVQLAAAPGLGEAAVQLRGGGTSPPDILINGGSERGGWALGAFPNPQAGNLYLAWEIWAAPLFGDRKTFPVAQSPRFLQGDAALSPDGKWLAYDTDETGRLEVYLIPFRHDGGKWQLSTSGGGCSRWRADGKELFYMSLDNKVMSVDISEQASSVVMGKVQPLFQANPVPRAPECMYDVTPDGQKFVVVTLALEPGSHPLTLAINWPALLKKQRQQ